MEMEVLIRELSETLITELALRDELEYEKEMKNSFISLLLAVQNKRRQYHVEKKRNKAQGKTQPNGTVFFSAVFVNISSHVSERLGVGYARGTAESDINRHEY